MKNYKMLIAIIGLCLGFIQTSTAQESKKEIAKTAVFSGRIYRSDTKSGLPNVRIILLDEKKSEAKDNSLETKTDEKGNFKFENIIAGKYTVSIQAVFDKEEDVPCQLLIGKLDIPNSQLLILTEKGKKVEQIFIKGFEFKKGKEVKKEIDLVCKSLFGKQ